MNIKLKEIFQSQVLRRLVTSTIVVMVVTFFFISTNYPTASQTPEPYKTIGYISLVGIAASGIIFALQIIVNYLDNNERKIQLNPLAARIEAENKLLKKEIEDYQEEFSNLLKTSLPSKELDMKALSELIRSQALSEMPEKVAQALENKYTSKSIDREQLLLIRERLGAVRLRFENEIGASGRRSNLNLSIGIIVTLIAAGLLAYMAFGSKPDFGESMTTLLAHYIPRITTIIFIEVFAFFFLRLYKSGLQEIKYFQNELTNIEAQQIAIESSFIQRHNKPLEGIIEQLMKTERNSIKQLASEKEEGGLSVKDVNSVIETVGKVTGKG